MKTAGPKSAKCHTQFASGEVDSLALANQFLRESGQQMRFATAGIAERQHVLATVDKRPVGQTPHLATHLGRQTFQLEALKRLFQRQPRLPQHRLDAIRAARFAFAVGQLQQILGSSWNLVAIG